MRITFRILDTSEVGRAHAWHQGFAAANDSIFPRTQAQFEDMVRDRQVWCAIDDSDEILGLCYCHVSEDLTEVEIGGLMVATKARKKGLGEFLFRLPLIQFISNERPDTWRPVPTIVSHAIKGNDKPLGLIERAGFVFHDNITRPGAEMNGLMTEADGNVHGLEFHLPIPASYAALADWIDDLEDVLRDGTPYEIDLLEDESIKDWMLNLRSEH